MMPVPVVCSFRCPPLDMTQFTYLPWLRGIWIVSVLGTDEHNYKHSRTGLWAEVFFNFSCIVGPCVSVRLSVRSCGTVFPSGCRPISPPAVHQESLLYILTSTSNIVRFKYSEYESLYLSIFFVNIFFLKGAFHFLNSVFKELKF